MKLLFRINAERKIKVNQRTKIALQALMRGREPDLRGIRDLLAVFLVDDQGEYLEKEAAREVIEDLDEEEFDEAATAFLAAFNESQLPKSNGKTSSRQSSTAATAPGGSST